MKARDLMTSAPEVVTVGDSVVAAATLMRELDVGCVPVVEDRDGMLLRGLITDRDVAVRHVAEGHVRDCPVREHMTPHERGDGLATARPEDTAHYLLEQMRRHRVRRVPIVEGDDRLVGIVAQADVALYLESEEDGEFDRVLRAISEPSEYRSLAPAGS